MNRRKNTPSKGPFGRRVQCDAVHGEVVFDGENALIPSVRRGAASDLFVLGSRLPYLVHLIEPLTVDRQEHIRLSAYLSTPFALFGLAGIDLSAPRDPKAARKHNADRRHAVLPGLKCGRTRKTLQVILRQMAKWLDTVWAYLSSTKPCVPLSIDVTVYGDRYDLPGGWICRFAAGPILAARSRLPQQGTSMRATVTLWLSFCRRISVDFSAQLVSSSFGQPMSAMRPRSSLSWKAA